MGMLDSYGQGANAFAQNFMQMYNSVQDRQLKARQLAQQKMLQDAQAKEFLARAAERERNAANETKMRGELTRLFTPQSAQDMAFQPGVIQGGGGNGPAVLTEQGQGMMNGQPSKEQLMGIAMKYASPKDLLTAGVSMANTEDKLNFQKEMQDIRYKNEIALLTQKQEQAQKLFEITQDNRFKMAADKAASDMALLMERMRGLENIQRMKNDGKKDPDNTYKDQQALARAQQMATRDLEKEYTHDPLTNTWLLNGVPVQQELINRKYKQYTDKYMTGNKKATTNTDPLGIR